MAAIAESKPKSGEIPSKESLNVAGYDVFFSKDYENSDTRGVVMYTKHHLKASEVIMKECPIYKDSVWVQLPVGKEKILVGCIYRSGTPSKAKLHDNELNKMIKYMVTKAGYRNVVLMGDFNYPGIKWNPDPVILANHRDQNHHENIFVDLVTECMLHQHVQKPTRDRAGQRSNTDDLVFTTDAEAISEINHIGHLGASDHQILTFELTNSFCSFEKKEITRYRYPKTDFEAFKRHMDKDWENLLKNKNAEEAYNIYVKHYKEAREKYVPKETIKTSDNFKKPIWMKYSTMNLIKRKKRAHIKYLNSKSNWDKLSYHSIRNQVTSSVRNDRIAFERNISTEIKNNNKVFWRYVNSQRKSKTNIPDLKRKDGTLATEDQEKAEILNEQFTSVFTKEDTQNKPDFEPIDMNSMLDDFKIKPEDVQKKLKSLRTDKSCGPDEIHPLLLKTLASTMSIPLAILYNLSLQTGMVPAIWKEGIVTALFKKGNKAIPANYRPITLTSIVCKIMEKLVIEKLQAHLKANNLEKNQQHGFTPKKSTTTNLIEALNIWSEALSHGLPVDIIYLDFEKAFDKVPHERLVCQLSRFGVRGKVLLWIKDYLTSRYQRVRVNGEYSSRSAVLSGVPQGSVLGPALFLIFVSDIPEIVQNFVSLYADDSKIYNYLLNSTEHVNTPESIQNDINNLCEWSNRMQMSFNVDKCHRLHLGTKNDCYTYTLPTVSDLKRSTTYIGYTYTFHNMKRVKDEKDLGVTIDHDLNFKLHISQKISKSNSIIFLIRNCFKYLDEKIFNLLYKALIRPHMEYASPIWSPITKGEIARVEGVQRRATRLVPELRTLTYSERLERLQLPTLHYRRLRQDLILLYNYINHSVLLNTNTHCSVCRNAPDMLQPITSGTRGHPFRFTIRHHSSHRNRFFTSRVLPIWNSLQETTVTAPTLNAFKARLSQDLAMPSQYAFGDEAPKISVV